jgi:hypothetical protein
MPLRYRKRQFILKILPKDVAYSIFFLIFCSMLKNFAAASAQIILIKQARSNSSFI